VSTVFALCDWPAPRGLLEAHYCEMPVLLAGCFLELALERRDRVKVDRINGRSATETPVTAFNCLLSDVRKTKEVMTPHFQN
jgi:hypothetical protein